MIAANLPVSKDCCNNVLKPVNTFGQTKLDLNLWRESLASHPSLDILIFVLGRSKPGQKCVFSGGNGVRQKSGFYTLAFWDREQLTRGRGNLVVNLQLHLGLERLCQYICPGWLVSPLHIQSSNTHYTYLWCANHPGFLMQKGPSDILIKICWSRWASLASKDIDPHWDGVKKRSPRKVGKCHLCAYTSTPRRNPNTAS